jgi:hypothetical protein
MAAVPDGEYVWRSAVYPAAFKKQRLSTKAFFKLYADTSPFVLEMSLVREKYAPTLGMVHGFGCRLAASQNRNLTKRGKDTDRIYCGAYQLTVENIRQLTGLPNLSEVKKAQVLHVVEDGEFAHSNMRIEVDTGGDEDAMELIKTLIVDRIWSKSAGPSAHICAPDRNVEVHPSTWLEPGPNGPCIDNRSKARIFIDVVLFFLCRYPTLWARLKVQAAAIWFNVTFRT